jgi:FdhD protein
VNKVLDNESSQVKDFVAVEEPLEIRLLSNDSGVQKEQSISITMRTPGDDFELAAGFLLTEGIVSSHRDIVEMSYCVGPEKELQEFNIVNVHLDPGIRFDSEKLQRNFYTTSSCGVCGKASLEALEMSNCPVIRSGAPVFPKDVIHSLPEKIRKAQDVFEKTGGIHAAALFSPKGDLLSLREDVGRHNAVDKLIGEQFLAKQLPLKEYLMMASGRTSFEILQKALMAGIPIVAAVGAPSSLAIDLAQEFNMTLIGFVRNHSFNIYSNPDRVAL